MTKLLKKVRLSLFASLTLALLLGACSSMSMDQNHISEVTLDGAHEVPPTNSAASGSATIKIASDKTVSGTINTRGIQGKMAHIHEGALGVNGPVLVPLTKVGDNTWEVPAGTKFTDAQYASYLAGKLYVNVHSASNPGGEIRGQILP
ncbi:CHRD domain-containing protein [Collimonas pratensis]|uniref:CHRD domain protein n=1 Tax=Collimonas pratensis TaxID=279113 RepID=A0A127QXR6_9BURK|nr:CHRD domain-containing protein [Collimonas pratensis]AMP05430.1 CHRD domain protein [Collimonas pratensis]AMP14542.1 CHRD domain protein [Collimonas pratensis]